MVELGAQLGLLRQAYAPGPQVVQVYLAWRYAHKYSQTPSSTHLSTPFNCSASLDDLNFSQISEKVSLGNSHSGNPYDIVMKSAAFPGGTGAWVSQATAADTARSCRTDYDPPQPLGWWFLFLESDVLACLALVLCLSVISTAYLFSSEH